MGYALGAFFTGHRCGVNKGFHVSAFRGGCIQVVLRRLGKGHGHFHVHQTVGRDCDAGVALQQCQEHVGVVGVHLAIAIDIAGAVKLRDVAQQILQQGVGVRFVHLAVTVQVKSGQIGCRDNGKSIGDKAGACR